MHVIYKPPTTNGLISRASGIVGVNDCFYRGVIQTAMGNAKMQDLWWTHSPRSGRKPLLFPVWP